MATNYGKTCVNENYGGMCRIYVDLYRDLLWAVFIDEVPIPVLVSELKKILANPRNIKPFHHHFKRLLDVYAVTGTIKNTDCDISVIYCFFRNIPTSKVQPPSQGWGKAPQPGDVGVTDDLERIHRGRNKLIGHAGEASITDADFTAHLSDIKDIVTRLDGHLGSSYLPHLLLIESDCQSSKSHLNHYDEFIKELNRQQDAEADFRVLVEENKQAIRDVSSHFDIETGALDCKLIAQDTKLARQDTKFAIHDTKLARQDTKFASQDTKFATQDTKFAALDTKFEALGHTFYAQGTTFETHETKFAAHDTKFAAQGSKFAAHDTKFAAHDTKFAAQDCEIAAQGTKFAAHDTRIAAQDTRIAAQDAKFDKVVSADTSSIHYGGHGNTVIVGNVMIGTVNNYGETGNSSTNRTAPGSDIDFLSIDYNELAKKNPSKRLKELAEESPSKKRKEHGSGVRMADGSVNYGGSKSPNVFYADVEAEKVCIGQPETEKNTNSSASGGNDEIDTVPAAGHDPGSATSFAGDLKAEHDNTLSEDIHDAINLSLKSVGRLWLPNSFGTAFRVGSKYAMTNWHVIRGCVDPLNNGRRDFYKLERCKAYITFSVDPCLPIQEIYYISSTVPYFDAQLDIAVVELKTVNSVNPPPALQLCTEPEECNNVNKLKVLGFGHPESDKKTEEFATVIPPESPRVKAAQAWLQQKEEKLKSKCRVMGKDPKSFTWDYRGWDDDKNVAIDLYKEKGSSGSPALLCTDATKVKVMAVVYRGLPDCFWELPPNLRHIFPKQCRIELAVKMSHIYVSMQKNNLTLTNDIFQCDEVDMEL